MKINTEEIVIRRATVRDGPAIWELWKELVDFHEHLNPAFKRSAKADVAFKSYIKERLRDDNSVVFMASAGEQKVGYCLACIAHHFPVFEIEEYGLINDLVVTAAVRHQGIGERLFRQAMTWFREREVGRVELRAALDNIVSTSFWRKMGFEPYVGVFYRDLKPM